MSDETTPTTTVRTTIHPDEEIEVDQAEYLDLQRQGLLVQEKATRATKPKES